MAYPTTLDSFTTKVNNVTVVDASHVNDLQTAVVAVETELGTTPKGDYDDVAARLDDYDDKLTAKNGMSNGAFLIWQRGTSFAAIATLAYTADRWQYIKSGTMVHTISRDSDVPTVAEAGILAPYSFKVDCTTADASIGATDLCYIRQAIEGYNWLHLAQREFTLSFWVKATQTGTYCVSFRNDTDRTWIAEYTVNTTNTWEKKIITVTASPAAGTWLYTTGIGLSVNFILAVGSNGQGAADSWLSSNLLGTSNQVNACASTSNNFWLALVKLEVGGVETPFVMPEFQRELNRCQRYYEKSFSLDTAPANNVYQSENGFGVAVDTEKVYFTVHYKVRKRAAATRTLYRSTAGGTDDVWSYFLAGWADFTSMSASANTSTGFSYRGDKVGTFTANNAYLLSGEWTADAEL